MKRVLTILLALPIMIFGTCAGVTWNSIADLFNTSGQNAILPNVSINNAGQAVAAWINTTNSVYTVQARYRNAVGVWGPLTTLSDGVSSVTKNTPAVSIDQFGNALVAWNALNPSNFNIAQVAIYPASAGNWTLPAESQLNASGNAGGVVGAWDGSQHAIIGWSIFGGPFQSTTLSTSWTSATPITVNTVSGTTENTSSGNLAVNINGDILVTWVNSTQGGGQLVEASFKPNGGNWTTAANVSPTTEVAQYPTCAIDKKMNGLISWSISNATPQTTLLTSQALLGTGPWSVATQLSTTASNPPLQEVGMDDSGDLSVTWIEHPTTTPVFNEVILVATKTLSQSAWTIGAFISDPVHEVRGCLSFQVDSYNNAVAVWSYDSENPSYLGAIAALSRPVCSYPSWVFPETILSSTGISPSACNVALNNNGQAVTVWATTNATTTNGVIQVANGSFAVNDVTNLAGSQLNNDFGLVSEYYNNITWTDSTSPGIAGYKIYRNGSLIATVGSSTSSYQDHDQAKDIPVSYRVTVFNTLGVESSGVTIIVQ